VERRRIGVTLPSDFIPGSWDPGLQKEPGDILDRTAFLNWDFGVIRLTNIDILERTVPLFSALTR